MNKLVINLEVHNLLFYYNDIFLCIGTGVRLGKWGAGRSFTELFLNETHTRYQSPGLSYLANAFSIHYLYCCPFISFSSNELSGILISHDMCTAFYIGAVCMLYLVAGIFCAYLRITICRKQTSLELSSASDSTQLACQLNFI